MIYHPSYRIVHVVMHDHHHDQQQHQLFKNDKQQINREEDPIMAARLAAFPSRKKRNSVLYLVSSRNIFFSLLRWECSPFFQNADRLVFQPNISVSSTIITTPSSCFHTNYIEKFYFLALVSFGKANSKRNSVAGRKGWMTI